MLMLIRFVLWDVLWDVGYFLLSGLAASFFVLSKGTGACALHVGVYWWNCGVCSVCCRMAGPRIDLMALLAVRGTVWTWGKWTLITPFP